MVQQACPELTEGLTTSGWGPVRLEALEGRTGYIQSIPSAALRINSAKQSLLALMRLLRACGPRNDNRKALLRKDSGCFELDV